MAIDANTGLPGSGKTLSAVAYRIVPALREGRTVVTNIPLKLEAVARRFPAANVQMINLDRFRVDLPETERASLRDEIPPGALVVLDELWRLWPSGMKTNAIPEDHKAFLAEHRHRVGEDGRSTDILLITQDLGQVAAFARQLVDKTAITTKLDAIGSKKRARVDFYQGAVTGHMGPKGRHIRSVIIKYQKEHFDLYQSHTLSQTGMAGTEVRDDKRMVIWRSPLFIGTGLLALFVVPWALGAVKRSLQPEEWSEPPPEPVVIESAPIKPTGPVLSVDAPQSMVPEALEDPEPSQRYSSRWRLVGTITKTATGQGWALVRGNGAYIRLNLNTCSHIENSPDYQCEMDGEMINVATGYGVLSGRTMISSN